MMFFRSDEKLPVETKFSFQPGWEGGELDKISWAIEIPEDKFKEVYEKLKADKSVKFFKDKPDWRQESYWGISVLDPMGYTTEVYNSPKNKPESTTWQD